jgi:hypothetical protein
LSIPEEDQSLQALVLRNRHLIKLLSPQTSHISDIPYINTDLNADGVRGLHVLEVYVCLTKFHYSEARGRREFLCRLKYVVDLIEHSTRCVENADHLFESTVEILLNENLYRLLDLYLMKKVHERESLFSKDFATKYLKTAQHHPFALAELLFKTEFTHILSDLVDSYNYKILEIFNHVARTGFIHPCASPDTTEPLLLRHPNFSEDKRDSDELLIYLRMRFGITFDDLFLWRLLNKLDNGNALSFAQKADILVDQYCSNRHRSASRVTHTSTRLDRKRVPK